MAKKKIQKTKGGTKKYGRAIEKCKSYKAAGTRERNKARKLRRHLKRHPKDLTAAEIFVILGV